MKVEPLAGQRQRGESYRAAQACNDFLRSGPGRSLPALREKYSDSDQIQPPTRSIGTLKRWSTRYSWQERAETYDVELERQKNARRQEVMESGLALDFERTDELKRLAHFLIDQVYEQGKDGIYHNIWLPDVKQIGSGYNAERIDIERFNAAIIDQLRGVLDDLAKETGGRQKRVDVTSAGESIESALQKLAGRIAQMTEDDFTDFAGTLPDFQAGGASDAEARESD